MLSCYRSKASYLGGLSDRYYRRCLNFRCLNDSRLHKCQLKCVYTWRGGRTLGKTGGGPTVWTEVTGGAVPGGGGGGGGGGAALGF